MVVAESILATLPGREGYQEDELQVRSCNRDSMRWIACVARMKAVLRRSSTASEVSLVVARMSVRISRLMLSRSSCWASYLVLTSRVGVLPMVDSSLRSVEGLRVTEMCPSRTTLKREYRPERGFELGTPARSSASRGGSNGSMAAQGVAFELAEAVLGD